MYIITPRKSSLRNPNLPHILYCNTNPNTNTNTYPNAHPLGYKKIVRCSLRGVSFLSYTDVIKNIQITRERLSLGLESSTPELKAPLVQMNLSVSYKDVKFTLGPPSATLSEDDHTAILIRLQK